MTECLHVLFFQRNAIFKSTKCFYICNSCSSWVLMDVLLHAGSFGQNVDIAQYWLTTWRSQRNTGFRNFACSFLLPDDHFGQWWGSIWQVGAPDCLETIPLHVALCIQCNRHTCRHVPIPFVLPHQVNCYHYLIVVTVTAVYLIFWHTALCCTLVYQNTRRATLLHISYEWLLTSGL